ncbi:MAG: PqiC family protein [Chthoniobacterales bacterium]
MRFLFSFCLLSLLTGCGGTGANYYRLNAAAAAPTGGANSGLSVAIGPVSLPSYIDRAEIVFASGPNEFQIPIDALWTGSLRDNISRTVATDLGQVLGSREVRAGLDPGFKPRYRVALDIRQFHGISGQEAVLDLNWRIQSGASGETISRHAGNFREPIIGDGYAALVAAESRLLEQCAAAMARSLR